MRASWLALPAVLVLLLAAPGSTAASRRPVGRDWADYELLVERNIFSRSRRARVERIREEAPPPPPRAETYVILRGVSRTEEGYVAFLEDMRSGEVTRVRQGEEFLSGTLTGMDLDGVVYAVDGQETRVGVAESLAAAPGPTGFGAGVAAPGAPSPAGPSRAAAGPSAPAGAADLMEQLRQRRLRELGQ
jgi:hypothetical protein